jgi:DNA integrity scanning protein DisA with diadenylate cyclase activity
MDVLPGPARRLAEELEEDAVVLPEAAEIRQRVVLELDHARRIPSFEGRRPVYGSFVMPPGSSLTSDSAQLDLETVALDDMDLASARTYSDGRSAFLVHQGDGSVALACFDRSIQYEADLVRVQEVTGAAIIQRTPVLRAVRLFTRGAVVVWDGRNWTARPTATTVLPALRSCAPHVRPEVARGVLDLAVHWLAPTHIGTTLVLYDADVAWSAFDFGSAAHTPGLSVTNRRHFPALFAALQQRDLAVLITPEGRVAKVGVGLLSTADADAAVMDGRGMRHRSAHRFSFDQPSATIVVVSEDGPVTIFREGRPVEMTHLAT